MEAPPLSTTPPIPTTTTPAVYPGSVDSSPRSRQNSSWDADPPASQPPPKLRLMCSYGGHIVPRPHDKILCYAGGDTRIIVIDRHITLSDLHHRLSRNLLHNQPFSLKYQLPNEDLDSLISVSSDEDLENMVEEYDRLHNSGGSKRGRLRLFLFPRSSSIVEQLIIETASTKSEDWFYDTLNGKSNTLSAAVSDRGFSDSSSVNCLLGLDDDSSGKASAVVGKDVEAQTECSKVGGNGDGNRTGDFSGNHVINQDVHSVSDSPMLETTSSFGSTSSPPSLANLPPIRVRVDEKRKVGIEEQFQQMSVGNVKFPQPPLKQEEVGLYMVGGGGAAVVVGTGGEYANRVISDDERSDHGGYRMVQQIQPQVQPQSHPQQQMPQFQAKPTGAFDLPSPDSVSSEGSLTNPLSRQRQAIYQEPLIQIQPPNTRISSNQVDIKTSDHDNTKNQMQPQVQEPNYILPSQYDQNHHRLHNHPQTFVHAGNQYISAAALPISPYYSIYPPQNQHHPILDPQHYPVYFVSDRQIQTPSPPGVAPQTTYGQTRNNIPAQYVGFAQIHQPPYEYADPNHGHMYYKPLPPQQAAAHYRTLMSATGIVVPDASREVPAENVKQQVRTSQG